MRNESRKLLSLTDSDYAMGKMQTVVNEKLESYETKSRELERRVQRLQAEINWSLEQKNDTSEIMNIKISKKEKQLHQLDMEKKKKENNNDFVAAYGRKSTVEKEATILAKISHYKALKEENAAKMDDKMRVDKEELIANKENLVKCYCHVGVVKECLDLLQRAHEKCNEAIDRLRIILILQFDILKLVLGVEDVVEDIEREIRVLSNGVISKMTNKSLYRLSISYGFRQFRELSGEEAVLCGFKV